MISHFGSTQEPFYSYSSAPTEVIHHHSYPLPWLQVSYPTSITLPNVAAELWSRVDHTPRHDYVEITTQHNANLEYF